MRPAPRPPRRPPGCRRRPHRGRNVHPHLAGRNVHRCVAEGDDGDPVLEQRRGTVRRARVHTQSVPGCAPVSSSSLSLDRRPVGQLVWFSLNRQDVVDQLPAGSVQRLVSAVGGHRLEPAGPSASPAGAADPSAMATAPTPTDVATPARPRGPSARGGAGGYRLDAVAMRRHRRAGAHLPTDPTARDRPPVRGAGGRAAARPPGPGPRSPVRPASRPPAG